MVLSADSSHLSSFRDPSGQMFWSQKILYRRVNLIYKADYDLLLSSGLYEALVEKQYLIPHQELDSKKMGDVQPETYKILQPELIPFVSYPYEWSFGQLKAAALLTLKIQFLALEYGMSLKDASAYNVQFRNGRAIFIDTLSFEKYKEGTAWVAYRQFCQHFLAPLALMQLTDLRAGLLSSQFLDGVPLDLAVKWLPLKARLNLGLATHLYLHARSQTKHADDAASQEKVLVDNKKLSRSNLLAILQSLQNTVSKLTFPKQGTEWGSYYEDTNYTEAGQKNKVELIEKWLGNIKPISVWDAGGNDATFSRLASRRNIFTVSTDIDSVAVEKAYRYSRQEKDPFLLPLVLDLTNPSPAIGWDNQERASFMKRGHFELSMVLALVHHLAISNNLPLDFLASFFQNQTDWLIIEFIPKTDSNVKRLLVSREDIFPEYDLYHFEQIFSQYFVIHEKEKIKESERTLFLMRKK
jgi:ribosomal protein L11 methylase PrmA